MWRRAAAGDGAPTAPGDYAAGAEGQWVTEGPSGSAGFPRLRGGACGQFARDPLVCSVVTRTAVLRCPRPGNQNPREGRRFVRDLGQGQLRWPVVSS